MNDTKQTVWVLRHTAGHDKHGQSVVYDEADGRDIAIVYDGDTDGPLIAAAPEMAKELRECYAILTANCDCTICGPCQTAERIAELLGEKLETACDNR